MPLSRKVFACLAAFSFSTGAAADIVYKPFNPSFGGEQFNSSHLQQLAGTQNEFKDTGTQTAQSESDRFVSMLQSRLYSSLASEVSDAIFGENAQQNGTITFDDQQVVFTNTGSSINLVITDFNTGQVTNISIPTLQ